MAFFEDIRNYIPLKQANTPIQVIYDNYVIITGHSGIKKYTEENIVFRIRKRLISIQGKNLKIVFLSNNEAYVEGEIKGVVMNAEE